jgi:beta-N-acetylhexosaminidase
LISRRRFLIGSSAAFGALAAACSGLTTESPTPVRSLVPTGQLTPTPPPQPSATGPTPSPRPPLRERIARLLVVGFRGTTLTPNSQLIADIRDLGLGGVILFGSNVTSASQLKLLTDSLQSAAGERSLLIAVDQEGGNVARLGPGKGFAALPSQAEIGHQDDANLARSTGEQIGAMLAGVGINLNLAPVVDLDINPDNPSIGALGRSFSADPDVVVSMAEALIAGERSVSRAPLVTLKHFPGLGSATGDTDVEFVDVSETWTPVELEPFRRLIADDATDLVMVGNALNRQLDPDYPASLSAPTIDLLRSQLGWDGAVITDDLGAGALRSRYSAANITRLALAAGNDLLLFANQPARIADFVSGTIDTIAGLVTTGDISESRIDEAYDRVSALIG